VRRAINLHFPEEFDGCRVLMRILQRAVVLLQAREVLAAVGDNRTQILPMGL
jgi:hypothetical protein